MKPGQCYVVIERSAFSCSSLKAAVDYCYKMFQILQLDYPAKAAVIWDFFVVSFMELVPRILLNTGP